MLGREMEADAVVDVKQERFAHGHRRQHAGPALLAEVLINFAQAGYPSLDTL